MTHRDDPIELDAFDLTDTDLDAGQAAIEWEETLRDLGGEG